MKKDISLKVGDKIAISRKLTVALNFLKPIESLKVSRSFYFHSLSYIVKVLDLSKLEIRIVYSFDISIGKNKDYYCQKDILFKWMIMITSILYKSWKDN